MPPVSVLRDFAEHELKTSSETFTVVCPTETALQSRTLFLGGGMSTKVDWQEQLIKMLTGSNLTFFNPRRPHFNNNTPRTRADIEWEHRYLCQAEAIVFWFPEETLCPISLYELGSWSMTAKKLFVGIHPNYARRIDVEVQTDLARPDVKLVYDLKALAEQVGQWANALPRRETFHGSGDVFVAVKCA